MGNMITEVVPIIFTSPLIHASTDVKRISKHHPAIPQRKKSFKIDK